jgi:antitoxin ParD1/3/4
MATMNISLPDKMKKWVEKQVKSGRYANASDYMRDLLRRDQERDDAHAMLEKVVDDAYASGISARSPEELRAWLKRRAEGAVEDDVASDARRRARPG